VKRMVRHGWAVQITRKDKTTFLASAGCGTHPAVWYPSNRKWAVAHKRQLRKQGFSCRVVRVQYMEPTVLPNAPDQARLQPSPEAGCSQGGCIHTKPAWDDDPVMGPLIREAYSDPANTALRINEETR